VAVDQLVQVAGSRVAAAGAVGHAVDTGVLGTQLGVQLGARFELVHPVQLFAQHAVVVVDVLVERRIGRRRAEGGLHAFVRTLAE
nr:hypothetical protein [Tanacetum cinerariifolium]